MSKKDTLKLWGYLSLIWIGWGIGEYPFIPSFKVWFLSHSQPSIEIYDKCISATLVLVFVALLLALWNIIWCRISLVFIVWGMCNNFIDEMNDKTAIFSPTEQFTLLLSILPISYLIWRHRRKSITN